MDEVKQKLVVKTEEWERERRVFEARIRVLESGNRGGVTVSPPTSPPPSSSSSSTAATTTASTATAPTSSNLQLDTYTTTSAATLRLQEEKVP